MIAFTVARELLRFATLKESRQSNIVRTSLESNYSTTSFSRRHSSLPFFSFFPLSFSFFILGPPSGPSSTVFMHVMWGEITGGLITCWSCESHSRGNASTTIKRLRKRIVLTTDTLIRCKHEIFSYPRVSSVKSIISKRMWFRFFFYEEFRRKELGNFGILSSIYAERRVKWDLSVQFSFFHQAMFIINLHK